ncbi:MAG TPA: YHS domain-containing protein [Geobacteraceae bacterium]|nr:YHS domain-containing protein [Geobacteraceae bacterium]
MFRKKLIVVMAAAVIGMAVYGGSGRAFAHEGHDHEEASGQSGSTGTADKVELCPVSGEKVDAKEAISYEYKGKVYHFCCASCVADFKKDPEKYIKKMQGEAAPEKSHDHGHE